MSERRERNERIHQILVFLATHDFCVGMTTIGRGVGLGYSTHLRKILDLMFTLQYLRFADIPAGSRVYRKWALNWDMIRENDPELFEDLNGVRIMWGRGKAIE